jgi:competence protein ComEA
MTLDLNTATHAQLMLLPGVGPALAEVIVSGRRDRGRFRSPDDLLPLRGIGDKTLARLRPFVRCSPEPATTPQPAPAPKRPNPAAPP